jgi:hypothetical protein
MEKKKMSAETIVLETFGAKYVLLVTEKNNILNTEEF